MKFLLLIFCFHLFEAIFCQKNGTFVEKQRVKRWGNYGNWNNGNYGPYGGGGGGGGGAPPPNNNVAIGYPTAYGLGGVGPRGDGGGSNPAPKFVVRCINGGAHIGQCRLDEDAICIALGGTCINSQCCTTPFYGLITTSTPTTHQPLIIDGDAFRPKMQHSSEEEDDSDQKERRKTSSEEEDVEVVEEVTESAPIEEEEKFKEIDELSKLLEFGKRNGLSTDSPIYAIFAGLFGVTSATLPPTAEWIRKETIPEQTIEITEKPIIQIFTTTQTIPKIPRTTTTIPNRITVTFKPPANSIETSSSEEAGVEGNEEEDYTKRLCDDGSHAIGPCNDDLSCPLDHTCQKGSICCFNFAAAAAKLFLHNNN